MHTGSIILIDRMILKDVLHVPDFQFKLISVKKLCKDLNCQLIFSDGKCFIQGLSQKEQSIPLGNLRNGLYTVDHKDLIDAVSTYASYCFSATTDARLWYIRLGHLPFQQMKFLSPELNIKDTMVDIICQLCPLAKQVRSSFPHRTIKTKSVLEMFHTDVCGPYEIKTYYGCTMFSLLWMILVGIPGYI